jgi:hypothetical protein
MGLHILNFSIDNPHTLLENSKVDSDFEEVDSFAELVLEDVMRIEDAIPEHHSKSPVNQKFTAKKMVWLFEQQPQIPDFPAAPELNYRVVAENPFYKNRIYASPLVNVISPPPKV